MAYLLDTSVLARLANLSDPLYPAADRAIATLFLHGELLHVTPQNFIEFRNIATRPKVVNGLGLTVFETESKAATYEQSFSLLADSADIYPAWKALVAAVGVIGKQVHDARLVAVRHVHKVTHLLTFNTAHFAAMAAVAPGIIIVDPASV